MKTITIGDQILEIKDYYCDDGNGYIAKSDYTLSQRGTGHIEKMDLVFEKEEE